MNEKTKLKKEFNTLSDFFIALGDEKRQAIMVALMCDKSTKGLQVTDLIDSVGLSRPAISHHLKILKQAGLVEMYSIGTKNYYYPCRKLTKINQLKDLLDHFTELIENEKK